MIFSLHPKHDPADQWCTSLARQTYRLQCFASQAEARPYAKLWCRILRKPASSTNARSRQSDAHTQPVALGQFLPAAHAQPQAPSQTEWPTKPLTVVIPYVPGGFSDTRFRLLAKKLSEKLGQPVIIDNKAGGGGVIGTAMVARATPDGYAIGCGSFAPLAINSSLMKKMPYDVANDLAPVILIENSPLILSVAKSLPVKNLAELIALAKKEPGKLTFGSSGLGGAHHRSGEMLRAASVDHRKTQSSVQ